LTILATGLEGRERKGKRRGRERKARGGEREGREEREGKGGGKGPSPPPEKKSCAATDHSAPVVH